MQTAKEIHSLQDVYKDKLQVKRGDLINRDLYIMIMVLPLKKILVSLPREFNHY
jgi:hypothetical protein